MYCRIEPVRPTEPFDIPERKHFDDSGYDLRASLPHGHGGVVIEPGQLAKIPTNVRLQIPSGYECQVRSRSGLAASHGISVLNSPGTIDASYTGEIIVLLINHGASLFVVQPGMRIAQLVFAKVESVKFWRGEDPMPATDRGAGGFGSTGVE